MSEQPSHTPQSESVQRNEQSQQHAIIPREMEGLEAFLNSESRGGNAGPNRAGANAIYKDGNIIFTNYAEREYGQSTDVIFGVRDSVSIKELLQLRKEGKPVPPDLIDEVTPFTQDKQLAKLFRERALQHNAYQILNYLRQGGDTSLLPPTPYMPDINALRKSLEQK